MKASTQQRRYAIVFTLLLALTLGAFAYASSAAGTATLNIPSSTADAACPRDGAMAPTASQGSTVSFSLAGYHANEGIAMSFTFPDGHVLDLPGVMALDGPVNTLNSTVAPAPKVDAGGELYFTYNLGKNWPVGCYSILAVGQSSGNQGKTQLVINPAAPAPTLSPKLNVYKEDGDSKDGVRGDVIAITGQGFAAGVHVSIAMAAPDGTIMPFPAQPLTSASGKFTTTFQFTQASPTGKYTFTASGGGLETPSTEFTLLPTAVTRTGDSQLTVIATSASESPPLYKVEVQGQRFKPLEGVALQLTFPRYAPASASDTVVALPLQRADAQGKFTVVFYLDQQSPTGGYMIMAAGSDSTTKVTKNFAIPPEITETPPDTPASTPTATLVPTATNTPTASPSPTLTASPTATPTAPPTATPTTPPTTTPVPTATAVTTLTVTVPTTMTATATPTMYIIVPPTVPGIPTPSGVSPTATATPPAEVATPAAAIELDPPGESASVDPPDSSSPLWDP